MQHSTLFIALVVISTVISIPLQPHSQQISDQGNVMRDEASLVQIKQQENIDLISSVTPLSGLVDGMIAQFADDSDADVNEELFLRQTEQDELSGVTTALKHAEQLSSEQRSLIDILTNQLSHATNVTENDRMELGNVRDALQHHSDNCRAEIPHLTLRSQHTQHDLLLLDELGARLKQISSDNTTSQQMSLVLAQLHHSLRVMSLSPSVSQSHPVTSVLTELMQFDEGNDNDNDDDIDDAVSMLSTSTATQSTPTRSDIERMHMLLEKLRSELATVLTADQNEITRIDNTCATQESELTRRKQDLITSLDYYDKIVQQRTQEIEAAQSVLQELDQEVTKLSHHESELKSQISQRMQVYMTLMKSRQTTLLTLGEMNHVLTSLVDQLKVLDLPELP